MIAPDSTGDQSRWLRIFVFSWLIEKGILAVIRPVRGPIVSLGTTLESMA
jgi:hypothetical protein